MNKKIKIIELVNRKAENKSMAKWIRAYYGQVHDDYKYDEELQWYVTLDDTTVLDTISNLNMEVEILEDNTEEIILTEKMFIPLELQLTDYDKNLINNCFENQNELINQLVKAINKLRKEKK